MPVNLAHHLKISRCGIFYFRMSVPVALRSLIGKREILHSLRTRSPATARKLAYSFASTTYALFEKMAYDPKRFNPADLSTFPTSDKIRPYEIDLAQGIMKSDGPEDHARMMEAIGVLKTMPPPPPAAPAPAQWVEPPPKQTITISKALVEYLPKFDNDRTRNANQREINHFIQHLKDDGRGDLEIHTVEGVDVSKWKKKLTQAKPAGRGLGKRSADNAIQFLQGLLNWAYDEHYIHRITELATHKMFHQKKSARITNTKGAEEFSVETLNKIFEPIAYAKYTLKYGKDYSPARYWIPLIALHTGMRKEEMALLKNTDIKGGDAGIPYFHITTLDRELKNEHSQRTIPIHDTLLRLGFMDYVRSHKGALFKETGQAVSVAFIRHLTAIGVKQLTVKRAEVLHSFRDTFNNVLVRAGVDPDLRLTMMGHAQGDANSLFYLTPAGLQRLKTGLDKLVFVAEDGGETHRLVL